MKQLFGKEPHKGVNPDEVVASALPFRRACSGRCQGRAAAGRHAALTGDRDLGRRVHQADRSQHRRFRPRKSQVFSTAEDNQNAVTIRVFQGEREMAADNKPLGQFDLVGIPPAPRGVPQDRGHIRIDANGIVNVRAKIRAPGKEQRSGSRHRDAVSEGDIQKMIKEAEAHAEEDKKRKVCGGSQEPR